MKRQRTREENKRRERDKTVVDSERGEKGEGGECA